MTVKDFLHQYINKNVLICKQNIPHEYYINEIVFDEKVKQITRYCDLYRIRSNDKQSHLFLVYKAESEVRMSVNGSYFTFGVGEFSFCYGKYIVCNPADEMDTLMAEYLKLREGHFSKMREISQCLPKNVFEGYQMTVSAC